MNANLYNPHKKGELSKWDFNFDISKAEIWFLYEHTIFLRDFVNDWTSHEKNFDNFMKKSPNWIDKSTLEFFWPTNYKININLIDNFTAYLNLNQYNIIDKHNDLEENSDFLFLPLLDFY